MTLIDVLKLRFVSLCVSHLNSPFLATDNRRWEFHMHFDSLFGSVSKHRHASRFVAQDGQSQTEYRRKTCQQYQKTCSHIKVMHQC